MNDDGQAGRGDSPAERAANARAQMIATMRPTRKFWRALEAYESAFREHVVSEVALDLIASGAVARSSAPTPQEGTPNA